MKSHPLIPDLYHEIPKHKKGPRRPLSVVTSLRDQKSSVKDRLTVRPEA